MAVGGSAAALPSCDGGPTNVAGAGAFASERFDDSPALVWLKDLDGRYLHANLRFTELLGRQERLLLGHSDRELPPRDVVDGPRVLEGIAPDREPLQLEYTIGPYEGRPALAALRFAVRDRAGDPIAICGVAAPMGEAHIVRSECTRLMQIERSSRLDAGALRREPLDERRILHAADLPDAPTPSVAHPETAPERPEVELDTPKPSAADVEQSRAENELRQAREDLEGRIGRLERELEQERRQVKEAGSELTHAQREIERMRIEAQTTSAALSTERAAIAALMSELTDAQGALASAQEFVVGSRTRIPSARRWTPSAQRAIAASIAAASDWRTGLKDAIKVLGSVGGWATVTAWSPGERNTLRCSAMWAASDALTSFQTQTWQRSEPMAHSILGAAVTVPHATALTEERFRDDRRLRLAAAEGMRSALLVPVRDGAKPIGLLEFLSPEPGEPDAELAVALEAVGVQLGHFAHLLRLGIKPHWSLGRV